MLKLKLRPQQDGYSGEAEEATIKSKVEGGMSRFRRDLVTSAVMMDVTFHCTPDEYQYLRAFYNVTAFGSQAFLIDLVWDTASLREYVVHFVPGTWKLSSVKGLLFTVKTKLEVMPNSQGIDYAQIVQDFVPEPYTPPGPPVDFGNE